MDTGTGLRRAAGLIGAAALALLLSACGDKAGAPGAGNGGMPPASVKVIEVAAREVPVHFDYVGQVAGSRDIEVHARVNGIVEKRLYEEGQRIREGQVMYRLDAAPYRARVAAADAQLDQAKAQLAQAEREYARIKPLADAEAASRKDADDAQSQRDLARAAVKAAEAQLQTARIDLGYTDVRAPLGGVAGRALKVEGSLAVAGMDSLLTTLAQTDPAYVNFGVGEAEYLRTRDEIASGSLKLDPAGFLVKITGSDGAEFPRSGRLGFEDYKADTSTGSFALRATFAECRQQAVAGPVRARAAVRRQPARCHRGAATCRARQPERQVRVCDRGSRRQAAGAAAPGQARRMGAARRRPRQCLGDPRRAQAG
jgi:membrane fusion protein (multidrug efflux system)